MKRLYKWLVCRIIGHKVRTVRCIEEKPYLYTKIFGCIRCGKPATFDDYCSNKKYKNSEVEKGE